MQAQIKFPFWTMDYSPWGSKNRIKYQLKKFLQVGVDMKCMHTNFGGCGYRDIATFQIYF